jgi:hypothetical protein
MLDVAHGVRVPLLSAAIHELKARIRATIAAGETRAADDYRRHLEEARTESWILYTR